MSLKNKTFEEEFPSMKGKRISVPDCQKCSEGLAFLSPVIQEYCLDKQRVKEAIKKLTFTTGESDKAVMVWRLMEELGLE